MLLSNSSKLLFIFALFIASLDLQAETWGKVEYKTLHGDSVRVVIQRQRTAKTYASMTIAEKGERPTRVALNEGQFRALTNWLRENFLHEQVLRNKRKESANCAQKSLGLLIEPGLVNIPLCADSARHQALAYRTDVFLNSFFSGRAVASTK